MSKDVSLDISNSCQNDKESLSHFVQCSFCESDCADLAALREHSSRCLTDIDDLLLVTFKPDVQVRSKTALRRYTTVYPNHSSIQEAVSSIQKEIDERQFNCVHCDWSGLCITTYNEHIKTRHLGLKYPCEKCPYVALTKRNIKIHTQEYGVVQSIEC